MSVWKYGRMGIWACGRAGVVNRISEHANTRIRPYLTACILAVLALLSGCRREPSDSSQPPRTSPVTAPTAIIYLLDAQQQRLKAVRVPLDTASDADTEARARYILTHYLDFTPGEQHLEKPFPPGTKLLDLQLQSDVAQVNFSSDYKDPQWWGGTPHAHLALYALVNTLTELEGIEKVKILIEGQTPEEGDCGGGEDLSQPLERDESLVE